MFIRINIFRWWQNLHVLRTPRRQTCAPARDRHLRHRSCQPLILSLGIIQQPRIFTEIRPWSNPDFQIPTNCSGFVRMFTSQMSPIATVWRCNPQTRHLQEAKTGFGKHFEPSRSIITNKQLTILGNNLALHVQALQHDFQDHTHLLHMVFINMWSIVYLLSAFLVGWEATGLTRSSGFLSWTIPDQMERDSDPVYLFRL
jgi:hypothetical protein